MLGFRLSVVLLMLILGVQAFVGRNITESPFAEQPGVEFAQLDVSVPPLSNSSTALPAKAQTQIVQVANPPEIGQVQATPALATASDVALVAEPAAATPNAAPLVQPQRDVLVTTKPITPKRYEVTGDYVNLRSGPSTDNRVLAQALEGDIVVWEGEPTPGWAKIKHPLVDVDVYMSANFLRRLPE